MQESVRRHYLKAMGINVWRAKNSIEPAIEGSTSTQFDSQTVSFEPQETTTELLDLSVSDIAPWLEAQCLMKIRASDTSANTLGDPDSDLLVLSQCLIQDKLSHQPFSGKSGVLLRNMLAAIGREPVSVLMGELDTPNADGKLLTEHLSGKQVRLVLLLVDLPDKHEPNELDRFRQRSFSLGQTGINVVVSYHPDYLCRHTYAKPYAWQDLLNLKALLGES